MGTKRFAVHAAGAALWVMALVINAANARAAPVAAGAGVPPRNARTAAVADTSAAAPAASALTPDQVRGEMEPPRRGDMGDIIVTARRVSERAQSIPITIQAFSAQALREAPITEARDLMYQTPGIYMGGSSSLDNTVYAMRGNSNTGQQGHAIPGVESYFADVPLPVNAQSQPFYDISSVQVLKGPQGTLFGRNTVGGAILIYPQAPDLHDFGGYIDGTYGSYDWRETQGAVNLPIIDDKLAIRISDHYAKRDGFIKNDTPGGPNQSNLNNFSVRAQIRFEPTDSISNTLMVDYYRSRTNNAGISLVYTDDLKPVQPTEVLLGGFLPLGTIGTGHYYHTETAPAGTPGAVSNPFSFVKELGITNHTDLDLGPVQLTNIAAYRRTRFDSDQSADGTAIVILDAQQRTNEEQFTEELQLKGDLQDGKVKWLLGGFYLHSNPLKGNASLNQVLPFLAGPGIASYPFNTQDSKAIYANVTADLSGWIKGFSLNAGLRYTWDKYKLCTAVPDASSPYNAAPFDLSPDDCKASTPGLQTASTARSKASAPTWTVGANYQITPDKLIYITSRRGFRSGGVNGPEFSGPLAALQAFGTEKLTDVEIGAKTQWRVGSVRALFNIAAFRSRTKNVQLGQIQVTTGVFDQIAGTPLLPGYVSCAVSPSPAEGGFGTGTNFDGNCNPADDPTNTLVSYNGNSRVTKGIELQGSISPFSSLTFSGNATFYHFHFSPGSVPAMLLPYAIYSGIGTDPAQSLGAKHNFTVAARYELPIDSAIGKIVLNVDYYRSGKFRVATFDQTPFGILNFRLDWNNIFGRPVDVGFFIRNALKEHYALGSGNFSNLDPTLRPVSAFVAGDPRMFGLEARIRFGSR